MKRVLVAAGIALLASAAAFAADDAALKRSPNTGPAAPAWVLPEATISEGFEGGSMPPTGWLLDSTNASYTWKIMTVGTPHSGTYSADVEYDPALVPQLEALYSPLLVRPVTLTVDFWSLGSIYWCRDTYDNCDLDVYLDEDTTFDNGNETLVYTADPTWPSSYVWAQSSVDLTSYVSGQDRYLVFVYEGTDGAQVALDDITIDYEEGEAGPAVNVLSIPTLGLGGMLALAALLGGAALILLRRS